MRFFFSAVEIGVFQVANSGHIYCVFTFDRPIRAGLASRSQIFKNMIGTVRKHSKVLWGIIIAATIVSFLAWNVDKNGRPTGGGSDGYDFGSINGKKVTRDQYNKAAGEVRILAFFSNGKWIEGSDFDRIEWKREIYNRLALFEKMQELNVRPTDAATVQWIKNLFSRGSNVEVGFDQFERAIQNNFAPHGVSVEQFEEFAKHELGREHLQSTYGLSGALVTPAEATELYRYENDEMHTQIALFTGSNYLSQVKVKDEDLGRFYTNAMSRYDLPERVQVNYVHFDVTNYYAEADKELLKATNLNAILDQQYYARTNEFKNMSREDALKKMREEVRTQFAVGAARKAAADVIQDLYKGHDDNNPLTVQDLSKLAADKNLQIKESPFIDRNSTTNELGLPSTFLQAASRLSNNDPEDKARERLYTATPVVAENGAYILGLKQRVPPSAQPFSAVKDKVLKDYKEMEAAKLARDAGAEFGKYLTNQIAHGKSFTAIAAEKNVKPVKLSAFSLNTRSVPELNESVDLRQLKVVTMKLTPGKASDFVATREGGFIVYFDSKTPADAAKMQAELPKFAEQIREQRQYAAYAEWFQKQVMDMHIVAPGLEPKTEAKPKS